MAGIEEAWGEMSSMSMMGSSAITLESSFPAKGESKGAAERSTAFPMEILARRLRLTALGLAGQLGHGLELGSLVGEMMPLMNIFVCGVY